MKIFPIFYECVFGKTATYVVRQITERSQYWTCFTDPTCFQLVILYIRISVACYSPQGVGFRVSRIGLVSQNIYFLPACR
jgi:hypothetical protein